MAETMNEQERIFIVRVSQPYLYRVLARDEEDARRQGMELWYAHKPAHVALWPDDFEVTEITAEQRAS